MSDAPDPSGGPAFDEDFLARPMTPDLVRAGFSLILGRPATDADAQHHLKHKNAGVLRETLLRSQEFRNAMKRFDPAHRQTPEDLDAVKTVFLHIPKTGGTTLHAALEPCFGPRLTFRERFDGLHRAAAGNLARHRFFSGHFSLSSCGLIPGPKRIVTLLRHPVRRLVSHYHYLRSYSEEYSRHTGNEVPLLARRHAMREFFSLDEVRRHPRLNNTYVRTLTTAFNTDRWEAADTFTGDVDAGGLLARAKENLRALHAFGILERYEESAGSIFRALGLPPPAAAALEPRMVLTEMWGKSALIERIELQECDDEVRRAMAPLVEADLELYNDGLGLFEARLKEERNRRADA